MNVREKERKREDASCKLKTKNKTQREEDECVVHITSPKDHNTNTTQPHEKMMNNKEIETPFLCFGLTSSSNDSKRRKNVQQNIHNDTSTQTHS
jgi:hypothetical protein